MLRIAIRCVDGTVVLDPANATTSIGQDGGTFIFENYDSSAHQPQPNDPKQGTWFPTPIAAGTPARPTPSILNTVTNPGVIAYTCVGEPALKGSINFTA
jgi:hypothetical protein